MLAILLAKPLACDKALFKFFEKSLIRALTSTDSSPTLAIVYQPNSSI